MDETPVLRVLNQATVAAPNIDAYSYVGYYSQTVTDTERQYARTNLNIEENFTATEKTKLSGIETGANNYTLPTASTSVKGGVKIGENISIDEDGAISATGAGFYNLPTASASVKGGIKVGENLSIDSSGVLSAEPYIIDGSANVETGGAITITDPPTAAELLSMWNAKKEILFRISDTSGTDPHGYILLPLTSYTSNSATGGICIFSKALQVDSLYFTTASILTGSILWGGLVVSPLINKVTLEDGATVTLSNRTEYEGTSLSSITFSGGSSCESWIKFSTASTGTISVTLPSGIKYAGNFPDLSQNGATFEISIKNGVACGVKVVD